MNKLYVSGNYIIEETPEGELKPYSMSTSYYDESSRTFRLENTQSGKCLMILFDNVDDWFDGNGISFTEATLREFLRKYTNFNSAPRSTLGANSTTYDTYDDLPDTGTRIGELLFVQNSQGSNVLPGSLGGTYFPAGWYMWTGTVWQYSDTFLADVIEDLQLNKANLNHTHTLSDITDYDEENILKTSWESLSQNLNSHPFTIIYLNSGLIDKIQYNIGGGLQIVKQLYYDEQELLSEIELSGDLPSLSSTKKVLTITDGLITNITYI